MKEIDSPNTATDTVSVTIQPTDGTVAPNHFHWEYWCIGFESALILFLILRIRYIKSEHYQTKQKMKDGEICFDSVIQNAFHSKDLYDQLKIKCHPDRFASSPELQPIATELFALLVKNRYNHQALLELKERMEKELNVKF